MLCLTYLTQLNVLQSVTIFLQSWQPISLSAAALREYSTSSTFNNNFTALPAVEISRTILELLGI